MSAAFAGLLAALKAQRWADFLTWGMMLLPLIAMVFVFRRQHRRIEEIVDIPSEQNQRSLFEVARGRAWMLCFLWGALTLTIVIYDLRYPSGSPIGVFGEATIAPAMKAITPQSVLGSSEGAAVVAQMPEMARDAMIDRIKSFYEDAFVSYYYLNKCGVAKKADNETLYRALITELRLQSAVKEADKVMDAAQGSFVVIYSESPCEASYLAPVQAQFDALIQGLPARLPQAPPK